MSCEASGTFCLESTFRIWAELLNAIPLQLPPAPLPECCKEALRLLTSHILHQEIQTRQLKLETRFATDTINPDAQMESVEGQRSTLGERLVHPWPQRYISNFAVGASADYAARISLVSPHMIFLPGFVPPIKSSECHGYPTQHRKSEIHVSRHIPHDVRRASTN